MESQNIQNVDPKDCRIWMRSPRLEDMLSTDEVESLRRDMLWNTQREPIIVRPYGGKQKSEIKYEVVTGTKRYAAAADIQYDYDSEFRLKAMVQNLTNKQAFELCHRPGPHQLDLSTFECALSYGSALRFKIYHNPDDLVAATEQPIEWVLDHLVIDSLPMDCMFLFPIWSAVTFDEARQLCSVMMWEPKRFNDTLLRLHLLHGEGTFFSKQELLSEFGASKYEIEEHPFERPDSIH